MEKKDTKHIKISEFNYSLPDERIAKFPLSERDQSKLLVYRRGEVSEDRFTSLPNYLEAGEMMVFNNTKVIQARLHFRKETGSGWISMLWFGVWCTCMGWSRWSDGQ